MDVAVVIVTWNVRDLVLDALRSLFADLEKSGLVAQVFLVDSGSQDGTAEQVRQDFPRVQLIVSAANLGFAAANNVALRQIGFGDSEAVSLPRAVYFLNPDTITHGGATRTLFDALMTAGTLGVVGPRLIYGDGSFQHSAYKFPGLRQLWVEFFPAPGRWIEGDFNGRYSQDLYAGGQPFGVDFMLGAAFMMRREVIEAVGMFDERFFMYCEEIDWSWRIRQAGWRIQCVPAALVTHLGGQSTGQKRPENVRNLWVSRMRLFHKHYPGWKLLAARVIMAVGLWLRARRATDGGDLGRAYRELARMALRR